MTLMEIFGLIKTSIGLILALIITLVIFKNSNALFKFLIFVITFSIGALFSTIVMVIFLVVVKKMGVELKKYYVIPILVIMLCMDLSFFFQYVIEQEVSNYDYSYMNLLYEKVPSIMESDFVQENTTIQNWLKTLDE
ncbi:hypothetical protein [Bacillus ndiopicus]|uniref:hypothetical protein n=1 Tax=Bacillus ndiopicus TaxID=1347368 RepID=UPI0005A67AB5|nr:hypothetical protein [Bacillus ndiopicus]